MAESSSIIENKNTISGRVITKNSGIGIPGLLVVIRDLDPNTTPEEQFPQPGSSSTTHLQTLPSSYDQLGSIITAADGSYSLSYDDSEFRIQNATEKRPDLFLMVLAPDDAESGTEPIILYKSPSVIQNAGRKEARIIKISEEQLIKAGFPIPNKQTETIEKTIKNYVDKKEAEVKLNRGIADFHRTIIERNLEEKKVFRENFIKKVVTNYEVAPVNGEMVKEGEAIAEKVKKVAKKTIDRVNLELNSKNGIPVNLYLTQYEKDHSLNYYFRSPVDDKVVIPQKN